MTEYRTIDVTTLKGLRQAERLHINGWKISRNGLFTIQFYRIKKENKNDRIRRKTIQDSR